MTDGTIAGKRLPAWWPSGWGELVIAAAAGCLFVLAAFPMVALGGRTFSTGWESIGVNGFNAPPPRVDVPEDNIRLDPGASAWQFEPWAEVTNRELRHGDVPLWNAYQAMGTPHAANFQSAVFDPLLAAVNLHPTPLLWDLSFLAALFLGAVATYFFFRDCHLGRLPAVVGTGTFMLSGYFFVYSNNQFFRSYLYLPLLLLLVRRTVASRHWFPPMALGLTLAGNLLLGMPETSVFVVGAAVLYCVFLLAFPQESMPRAAALMRLGCGAVLGACLAAPLLLPAAEFTRLAFSAHEKGSTIGQVAAAPRELLGWLAPFSLGKPTKGLHGHLFSGTRDWVGMAGAVSAFGALAAPVTMRRHGGWFFAGLGAAVLGKSYGFPLLGWVGRLPVLERSNFVNFALPIAAFCAAALVAMTLQGLMDNDVRRTAFVALSTIPLGGLVVLVYLNRKILGDATTLHLVRNLGLAVMSGALVCVGFLMRWRRRELLVAFVVLVELALLVPRGFQEKRADAFVESPWLRYVIDNAVPSHERVYATDGKLFPNVAAAFGLQDIRSLDALYLDRYVAYVKAFLQPSFRTKFVGGPIVSEEVGTGEIAGNPMFDLTGVRFVITGGTPPGPPEQYRELVSSDGAHVYENAHRMPRALVLNEVAPVRNADDAMAVLKSLSRKQPNGAWRVTDMDPRRRGVVEGLSPVDADRINQCREPGTASITRYRGSKVVLTVDSPCPGLVMLTDMYHPGWHAKVNGRPTPIRPTDVAFRSVVVSAGRSVVEFDYAPRTFRLGMFLALAAMVSAAAVVVVRHR